MAQLDVPQPHRPASMPEYAVACLDALALAGLGGAVSLGGALGLLHYLDYRTTHDVDAWWVASATGEERRRAIEVVEETLGAFGSVRTRAWGDVVSVELHRDPKTVFSFQVAERAAQLEPPTAVPGLPILLDSFADLVASKMTALVERGAPRDFRDIHAVCSEGLITPRECWELWRRRQELAGGDCDSERARLAVQTHLARIAQHRPLDRIADATERERAEQVRSWFAGEFLDAIR